MGLNRYAKKRDKNESQIVYALRLRGADVEKLDTPVDLLIGYRGVTVLAEIKAPRTEPTKTQLAWLSEWKGGRRTVLKTVDDAHALLEDIEASQ